jgi:hypothetical protein
LNSSDLTPDICLLKKSDAKYSYIYPDMMQIMQHTRFLDDFIDFSYAVRASLGSQTSQSQNKASAKAGRCSIPVISITSPLITLRGDG